MGSFVVRRALQGLLVVWLVATGTFVLVHAAPGGPAVLADPKLTAVERQALEAHWGLDQPLAVQYARWIGNATRGDFGRSFLYQTSAGRLVLDRLPNTVLLVSVALGLALLVALPLGTRLGAHPGTGLDRSVGNVTVALLAVPPFWLGILGILLFAVELHWLPAGAMISPGDGSVVDRARHLVLPSAILAIAVGAELVRFVRAGVMDAARSPHLTPARARGVPDASLTRTHVVRNALLPITTALGLQVPVLVGGAAVTETVFAWPGMGRLGVEAALGRDYPVVMAITVSVAAAVVVTNFALDLVYAWADPRVRVR